MSAPSASPRRRLCALYNLGAGAIDAVTGPWLVFSPATALAAMGAEPEPDALFVSFVGAFVAAVGLSYWWAAWRWWKNGDTAFLRAQWRLTILFRLAAGLFCIAQIALDNLGLAWASVPATDFALALIQVALLRARWPDGADPRA